MKPETKPHGVRLAAVDCKAGVVRAYQRTAPMKVKCVDEGQFSSWPHIKDPRPGLEEFRTAAPDGSVAGSSPGEPVPGNPVSA